jgi:hypothetical protein
MSKRLIWSVVLSVIPIKRDRIHRPLPPSIFFSDLRRAVIDLAQMIQTTSHMIAT